MKTRQDLFQTSRGFWPARALLTGVEVGVFEALGRRRLTGRTLAKRLAADARATTLLLDALVGIGALSKRDGAYGIPRALLPLLSAGEDSALEMLRHHVRLWRAWDGLTDRVRQGARPRREGFRGDEEQARAFTLAMQSGARQLAPAVAEEAGLDGARLLLDLGGGPGVYAAAFARRSPSVRVLIVDLPAVCRTGRELLAEEADVRDRIAYHAADLDRDPLPPDADAAFLSHVIHSQGEDEIRALFRRVRRALVPGATFVVRDFFTSPDRTKPPSAALFALNMLVHGKGRTYSVRETKAWLAAAGFVRPSYRASEAAPGSGYVVAHVPAAGRKARRRG